MECDYCREKIKDGSTKYIETQEFHQTVTRADYELSGKGCSLIRVMDRGTVLSFHEFQVGNAFYCNIDFLFNDMRKQLKFEKDGT